MTTSKQFLILDLNTGRMDGWYGSTASAEYCCETRRKKVGGRWIVVELVNDNGHKIALTPELCNIRDLEMDLR